MDRIIQLDERIPIGRLPDRLLALGIHQFTTADAARAAGIKESSARPALTRLVKAKQAFSPARGLYVAVPPEYRSWGAVPASWFIDALMGHLDRRYYVGLLSAAELHEAAHQRPQVFQVMVDRHIPSRNLGRVRLRFLTNHEASILPTVRINVPVGTIAVSTPELTAFDLANRPADGAGLDNVATIVAELAREGKLKDDRLVELVDRFPIAAARRVGWLIEQFGDVALDALADHVATSGTEPSLLNPHGPRRGKVDKRWCLRVNRQVEPDL